MRAQNQPGLPSCRWATPQNLGLVEATEEGLRGLPVASEDGSTFKNTSGLSSSPRSTWSIRGLKNYRHFFQRNVSGFLSKTNALMYAGNMRKAPARGLVGLGGVPADLGHALLAALALA